MSPEVAVVIPARDAEARLPAALDSVFAQHLAAAEVVVVDDGSVDATARVAAGYAEVRVMRTPGAGVSAARNLGIAATTAPLVAFLDADDRWTPGKLTAQCDLLARRPDLGYVGGGIRFVRDGIERPAWWQPVWDTDLVPSYIPSALVVRRAALGVVGPFDEDYRHGEDIDWLLRATDAGVTGAAVADHVLDYVQHGGNVSHDRDANAVSLLHIVRASLRRKRATAAEGG